jgi:hypothetical protein
MLFMRSMEKKKSSTSTKSPKGAVARTWNTADIIPTHITQAAAGMSECVIKLDNSRSHAEKEARRAGEWAFALLLRNFSHKAGVCRFTGLQLSIGTAHLFLRNPK